MSRVGEETYVDQRVNRERRYKKAKGPKRGEKGRNDRKK
jgi:hypothetical protein